MHHTNLMGARRSPDSCCPRVLASRVVLLIKDLQAEASEEGLAYEFPAINHKIMSDHQLHELGQDTDLRSCQSPLESGIERAEWLSCYTAQVSFTVIFLNTII